MALVVLFLVFCVGVLLCGSGPDDDSFWNGS